MNSGMTKTYLAGAACGAHLIVKVGADAAHVVHAAAATDLITGVSTDIASAADERIDVVHSGIAHVIAGGVIAAGKQVTSDADGKAVEAAPAATATDRVLGVALINATAADEIIDVLIQLGSVSNAANA